MLARDADVLQSAVLNRTQLPGRTAMLTAQQIEAFNRDGCITIEDAVSVEQLDGMRAAETVRG